MEQSPWKRPGYQFVCQKLVEKSRANVELIVLVPKELNGSDLIELIEDACAKKVQILFMYRTVEPRCRIVEEDDIQDNFRVFCQTLHPPWDLQGFVYREWLARMMLPHLILSCAKFKWREVTPTLIFLHTQRNLMASLLRSLWPEIRLRIRNDVTSIMADPDRIFCYHCQSDCPLIDYPCHVNLFGFEEVTASNPERSDFFTRLFLFGSARPVGDENLLKLYELHEEIDAFSYENKNFVLDCIDENCYNVDDERPHCCYLVCVLNGPSMELTADEEEERSIQELLEDETVYKFLYVGVTEGTEFRRSHLRESNSGIFRVLSKNAKMFTLRRYITNSKLKAERNESFLIELLKAIVTKNVSTREKNHFLLLNKFSGPASLLGVDDKYLTDILDYVESDKAIFVAYSLNVDLTYEPSFIGNYGFQYPINTAKPKIVAKNYDQVKDHIQQVVVRNATGRWLDFRH